MATAIACSHTVCFSFLVCCVVWRRQPVTALSQKWEKRVNIVPLSLSCSNCYLTLHSLKCCTNLAIPTCVAVPTAFFTLAVMSFLCIFRTALATGCAKHCAATAKQSQCQRHGGDAANDDTPRGRGGGGGGQGARNRGGGGQQELCCSQPTPAQNLAKQTLCPGPILSQRNMCCSGPVNLRLYRVTVQPHFSTITSSFEVVGIEICRET